MPHEIGISVTSGAWILFFISLFSIVGRFIVPILAERFGGKPVMVVALFLQGATVLVLFFANDLWAFYLFGTLFGLGFGGEMSAYLVVNRQYFGAGPMATLYGWEIMGAMMGHAIATVMGGLVILLIGYLPVFALSMGFSIVGVLVILTLESTKRVLIPDWEESLPPEARTEALYSRQRQAPAPCASQRRSARGHSPATDSQNRVPVPALCPRRMQPMVRLIDLTLTLGSERVSEIPGLMGVETSPLMTHESHARSNQRLCLATHIGTHVDAPLPLCARRRHRRRDAPRALHGPPQYSSTCATWPAASSL